MNLKKLLMLMALCLSATSFADDEPESVGTEQPEVVVPNESNACTDTGFRVVWEVPHLERIPRYDQGGLNKQDSQICFAATAAQVIDVFRHGIATAQNDSAPFVPSSPLLMASLYYHTDRTPSGVPGGDAAPVIQNALRMGTCQSLVPVNQMQNNTLTVIQEIEALQRTVRAPDRTIYRQVFENNHTEFYNRTMQQCQPNYRMGPRTDQIYATQTYDVGQWDAALETAQNSRYGVQAVAVAMCAQVLRGEPFNTAIDNQCSGHYVAVVGRRCHCGGTDCQVLVRNSYPTTAAPGPNQEHVRSGDFWMSEAELKRATMSLTVITGANDRPLTTTPKPQASGSRRTNRAPASVKTGKN